MKKILIIIGILFFSNVFGNLAFGDFRLEVDNEKVDINENFQLKINIENEKSTGNKQIEISGIDDFDVLGQSYQSSFRSINGKTTSSEVLVLTLKPKEKGDFTLGPVKLAGSNEKVVSNFVKISVDGDKIFLGNNGIRIKNNSQNNSQNNLQNNLVKNSENNSEDNFKNNFKNEEINFEENNLLVRFLSFLVLILGLFFLFRK